ncbi:unnamed protein product [Gadus morhua 'NCC']
MSPWTNRGQGLPRPTRSDTPSLLVVGDASLSSEPLAGPSPRPVASAPLASPPTGPSPPAGPSPAPAGPPPHWAPPPPAGPPAPLAPPAHWPLPPLASERAPFIHLPPSRTDAVPTYCSASKSWKTIEHTRQPEESEEAVSKSFQMWDERGEVLPCAKEQVNGRMVRSDTTREDGPLRPVEMNGGVQRLLRNASEPSSPGPTRPGRGRGG